MLHSLLYSLNIRQKVKIGDAEFDAVMAELKEMGTLYELASKTLKIILKQADIGGQVPLLC